MSLSAKKDKKTVQHEPGVNVDIKEIRCRKCRKLLMKGLVQIIEIKCSRCGYVQKFSDNIVEF